jgi:hypothetical protein
VLYRIAIERIERESTGLSWTREAKTPRKGWKKPEETQQVLIVIGSTASEPTTDSWYWIPPTKEVQTGSHIVKSRKSKPDTHRSGGRRRLKKKKEEVHRVLYQVVYYPSSRLPSIEQQSTAKEESYKSAGSNYRSSRDWICERNAKKDTLYYYRNTVHFTGWSPTTDTWIEAANICWHSTGIQYQRHSELNWIDWSTS